MPVASSSAAECALDAPSEGPQATVEDVVDGVTASTLGWAEQL